MADWGKMTDLICCWLTDIVTGVGQDDVHIRQDDFLKWGKIVNCAILCS